MFGCWVRDERELIDYKNYNTNKNIKNGELLCIPLGILDRLALQQDTTEEEMERRRSMESKRKRENQNLNKQTVAHQANSFACSL